MHYCSMCTHRERTAAEIKYSAAVLGVRVHQSWVNDVKTTAEIDKQVGARR